METGVWRMASVHRTKAEIHIHIHIVHSISLMCVCVCGGRMRMDVFPCGRSDDTCHPPCKFLNWIFPRS
jgi:hypothetical protein